MATIVQMPQDPNALLMSQAAQNLAEGFMRGRQEKKLKEALATIDSAPDRETAVGLLDNLDSDITSNPQFFQTVVQTLNTRFPTDLIEEPFFDAETGEVVIKQRPPGSAPFSPEDLTEEGLTREAPATYFIPTPDNPAAPITLLGDSKITKTQAEELKEQLIAENPELADAPILRGDDLNLALAAHNKIRVFKAKTEAEKSITGGDLEKFERQAQDELRRRGLDITEASKDRAVNTIDKLPRAIQNADQLFSSSFGQGIEDILAVDSLGATAARDIIENSLFYGLDETDAARLGFVAGLTQSVESATTEPGRMEAMEKFELQTGLKYDFYLQSLGAAAGEDLQTFDPIEIQNDPSKAKDMLYRIDNDHALILLEGHYVPITVDTYNKFIIGSSIFAD